MSILDKKYVVEMEDGSKWAVPVRLIAEDRAKYFADLEYSGNVEESLKDDTIPLFESDDYEIHDWASNNLNWDEVKAHAIQVKAADVDFQEGWVNGEYSIS